MGKDGIPKKPRKRQADTNKYKRNVIKKSRVEGTAYTNYKNKQIPLKVVGLPCSCKQKCFEKLNEEERLDIFNRFHSFATKDEQDIFLQGSIEVCDIKQRRPRQEGNNKPKSHSYKYFVLKGTSRMEICQKAFLSLYAVSEKRIRRIRELTVLGQFPRDLRGKNSSANTLSEDVKLCMKSHIESFPTKLSHYSGREVKYLDSQLNIKIMFELFKQKYVDLDISYASYRKFFRENFNLFFGRPQIDVCSTCELLNNKIKDRYLNDTGKRTAVAELVVHKRRSKKFYTKLKSEVQEKGNEEVLTLSFDFMQNIQLPKTPVGEVFYYNQLTVSCFCIHNVKQNTAKMYIYHEGQAKKTADEICSFLLDYLKEIPESVKELRLFSDNCWGQNKNHTLIRMLLFLTDSGRFTKIIHYFPVRGHSFLPCDRDFAIIKRNLRKHDRIYTIHQITEIIITSSNSNKFMVKEVDATDIINFRNWWPKLYKKNCTSEETKSRDILQNTKIHFNISTFSSFLYDSQYPGRVEVSQFIDGFVKHTFQLKQPGKIVLRNLPTTPAYPLEKIPIKQHKMEHIKKCAAFVPEDYKPFYDLILLWPTTCNNNDTDDVQ